VDEPSSGTLRLSADKILTCLFVTYTGILTCMLSSAPYGTPSQYIQRSPTRASPSLQLRDGGLAGDHLAGILDCSLKRRFRHTCPTAKPYLHKGAVKAMQAIASVACLAPLHFRRRVTRPVSYYALFQWWLLLSQHPGCLCNSTSFPT
jgi:hypothetical protein